MFEGQAEVKFNRQLNADTWIMGLTLRNLAASAKPGQFVMIRVKPGTDPLLRRPFSICGIRRNLFLVLYRVVGQGTTIMRQAKEGEKLSVLGPLGKGFEPPPPGNIPVLVGGGIGIAPLCFLSQSLRKRRTEFMMGFGSADEILRLDHMRGPHTNVSLATDDGTRGHAGFVTDLLEAYIERKGLSREALSLFACGPKPMLKKVAQIASAHRLSCQVSLEASMACGLGACQGCAVKAAPGKERPYQHVCKDGPVFEVEAVDWNDK